ncbi:MAG: M20/M25/M40 family metallo-hydrolase [Xanthomonadales bacterium]|nr:M20/M25/M40 family metallo-hydrolase [Xanthomonadales bacterium]
MRHWIWALPVGLLLAGCGGDEQPTSPASENAAAPVAEPAGGTPFDPAAQAAAETITAEEIRTVVAAISADSYGGRGPGTQGDRMTQAYLAQALQAAGYEPGAPDGTYLQTFDLVGIDSDQPDQWTFEGGEASLTLAQNSEFIVGSGMQADRSVVEDAELVFVGYGIQAPEYDWDDFKGQDLAGKVLVMLNNDPHWDEELFEGERRLYYGRWDYKYESAARQGAAGAIIIHTPESAGYPWQVVQTSWTGPQFELPAADEPRMQIEAWVTEEAARQLFEQGGQDLDELVAAARTRDFQPVPLGLSTSIAFSNELTRVQSANVLGLLRGSDEDLADEVVVYTAHHDHLGTAPADSGLEDRIYNGARDNATGVAMVLEIARAFSELEQPPSRSVLIAFVGAEEQGLLGAKYFARHPTVPAGKIAAAVNLDSGNIWGATRDITFVGKGKSTLDEVADEVARHLDRTVRPDQSPDKGYYYRSDQFALAKIGVPALYLKNGIDFIGKPEGWGQERVAEHTEAHYHQTSDELTEAWSFDGLVADAVFAFWAGYLVANDPELPAWAPGDEFEAARQEALAELP